MKLYAKLLAVQKEIKAIEKDSVNPHFKNRYFDINTLIAGLKPVITKNGIVVIQPIVETDHNTLKTIVIDAESGETLESSIRLPDTEKAQELGSALTYYRRYALQSLFLLEAEDDDGEVATSARLAPKAARVLSPTAPRKTCETCGKEFNPKPGTEAFAKQCYDCYLAEKNS